MKLRKDNKKAKYVVKKNTVNEENEKSNIIEEIYKEKIEEDIIPNNVTNKNLVNLVVDKNNNLLKEDDASTDDGIVNLEKKLCNQYEQELEDNIVEEKKEIDEIVEKEEQYQLEEQEIIKEESENKEEVKEQEVISEDSKPDEVKKEKKKFTENIVIKKIINAYKTVFSHPEDIEKSVSSWLDSGKKFAFLTALIVGIITHITFLTEMIMSPDGLWNSICYCKADNW